METLQAGYLHVVAAAAGCTLARPHPDRGTDWTVTHESTEHVGDPQVDLKVQLKSTHQVAPNPPGPTFPITLSNPHLQQLAQTPVTITRILVVMLVPREIEGWVSAGEDHLAVRHYAYWANLEGEPVTGRDSTTVRIRTDHVFDDVALCAIMQVRGQGGVPR